jgi:membrane fusion protein (multidrug efflux system)
MSTATATHPQRKPVPALAEKTDTPSAAPPPEPEAAKEPTYFQRHKRAILIAGSIVAAIVLAYYLHDAYTHEETDDAYVTGHLHEIAPRINGVVTEVLVNDNQKVKAGQVLVKLDPSEYIALSMAAKANLDDAQANYDRLKNLVGTNAISKQDLDNAISKLDTDEAEYELAKLQIVYCTITSPADGFVGRKNVEVGNRVSSGETLMDIVEPDLWIVANFKETQLAHMQRGQPVSISIDSIPGKVFKGYVDSFSPATGNEFALLPADNSTGNFTKIVQRVPVKIVFDRQSIADEPRLRAGESAVVKVALTKPGPGYPPPSAVASSDSIAPPAFTPLPAISLPPTISGSPIGPAPTNAP